MVGYRRQWIFKNNNTTRYIVENKRILIIKQETTYEGLVETFSSHLGINLRHKHIHISMNVEN